jgi:hypothetical protein
VETGFPKKIMLHQSDALASAQLFFGAAGAAGGTTSDTHFLVKLAAAAP